MRVIAYVPTTDTAEKVTNFFDKELPEKDFLVEYAVNGDDLNQLIKTDDHDVVLVFVDDAQPKPYAVLQSINQKYLKGPVVTIYKDNSPKALLNALSHGSMTAFDFNKAVLSDGVLPLAIKNAHLGFKGQSQRKIYGPLEVDFSSNQIFINGNEIHFPPKQYALLEYLMLNKGASCSKERLFNALYRDEDDAEIKIIDVYISKIRGTLNDALSGLGDMVETDWGNGYRFNPDIGVSAKTHTYKFGSLEIDLAQQEVRIGDRAVDLTINEFMVMKTFALAFPDSVNRGDLIEQVSKFGRDANSDTIDRLLYSIGRNLTLYGDEFDKLIVPVNGGDKFIMNVSRLDDKAARKVEQDIVGFGPVRINKTLGTISVRTTSFDATDHEIKILDAMIEVFPAHLTGMELVTKIYGEDGKLFNLNNHLTKLRTKLREANGGEDLIVSRRGMGYNLAIQSERILAKVEDKLDIVTLGPWILDRTRKIISYAAEENGEKQDVILNKSQFTVFETLMSSYPAAVTKNDLLRAVYGDDNAGKDSALNSLFSQMKGILKTHLGDYRGGFRKITNGTEKLRLDLDIDDISFDTLKSCDVKEVGPWAINATLNMFFFDGDPIDVNESEYAVIQTLIQKYPKPISTAQLAKKHFDGKQPSLNTCLTVLRKKISETYGITEPFIQNKRGLGYSLVANRDELDKDQIQSINTVQIGDVTVNMDMGQLSFGDKTVELNAAELFTMKVLIKANRPVTAKILSDFSKAAGQERETVSMYQAVRSLEDKMAEAGFEGQLIDKRRHAGFFLSSKLDEITENSDIQTISDISLNKTLYELTVKRTTVSLTPSEFKFIETLAENSKIPLTLEDLSKLSDEDGKPFAEMTLNIAKNNIKKKLIQGGLDEEDAGIISNKVRVGYFLTSMSNHLDRSRINGKRETALTETPMIQAGCLSIHTITDRVEYDGTVLEGVSGKPLDVLMVMAKNYGDFLTNKDLSMHFFGDTQPDNIANVERGIKSLVHMINRTIPNLGQSLIMKVGDKGYGLTLSMEDRESLQEKAGFKKPSHKKPQIEKPRLRGSLADQLAALKLG